MKILVAVDGSATTRRMLAYLAAHDEWLGDRHDYTVVHAVPTITPRAAAVLGKAVVQSYYDDEAEKVFKPIRTFFTRQGLQARFDHKSGAPAEVVLAAAKRHKVDLIVMGTHGQGALARLVLGSVANRVVASTQVPVLLVR